MHKYLAGVLMLAAGCTTPTEAGRACGASLVPCPEGYFCDPDGKCRMHAPPVDMAVVIDMAVCTPDSCKAAGRVCDPSSHACVDCLKDGDCASGKLCMKQSCVPGCNFSHGCPDGGGACQNGMCHACGSDNECGGNTPHCDMNSGLCVACVTTTDCDTGFYCEPADHKCHQGCDADNQCKPMGDGGAQSMRCCNHMCYDVANDRAHCGACGTNCGQQTCCGGMCADLTGDLTNCGACGRACAGGNANWTCTQSACAIASCKMGFDDCNKQTGDGCEANLASDLPNCGGCGKACQYNNATATCQNGGCVFGMCKPGFADCDMQPGNGCEVNIDSDGNNCGGCGKTCSIPNANAICLGGKCAIGSCSPGFSNCDGDLGNGCELDTSVDVNNCGGCNNKCDFAPNATVSCVQSMCLITGCINGLSDCDKVFINGCETDTTNNVNNCGMCGKVCAKTANVATVGCANAACTVATCNAGFGDCDKQYANGCEVNLNTDKNNCGMCAKVCPQNQNCFNGACSAGVSFTATYTQAVDGQAQCANWNAFRAALGNGYNGVTIKGSFDGVGRTCNNSGANEPTNIANALRLGQAFTVNCGGIVWGTGTCGSGIELNAGGSVCLCQTPGWTHRPCIGAGNPNWGGVNTTTCSAPTQTITITFF